MKWPPSPPLTRLALAAALALAVPACAPPPHEPEIASPAGEARYAIDYSADMQALTQRYNDGENQAREVMGKMPGYSNELKDNPPWPAVADMVERADKEGRSAHYVDAIRESRAAAKFWDEEGEELQKKAGGAATFAAKQGGCTVDVYGAVSNALKTHFEKRLKERLHDESDAHLALERNADALGPANVELLEKQLDEISLASYLVHIELVEIKVTLRRMVQEAADTKTTMEGFVDDEQKFQGESGRKPEEKKASEERVLKMKETISTLDAAKKQADALLESVEDRQKKLKDEHEAAVGKLLEKLRSK